MEYPFCKIAPHFLNELLLIPLPPPPDRDDKAILEEFERLNKDAKFTKSTFDTVYIIDDLEFRMLKLIDPVQRKNITCNNEKFVLINEADIAKLGNQNKIILASKKLG